MTECEYRRGTLVSLAERCARTTANVAHAPLSQKAREAIHGQSTTLQKDFQELHGKLQVAQRHVERIRQVLNLIEFRNQERIFFRAHWLDYCDAENKLNNYLSKSEANLKKLSQPSKLRHLNETKATLADLKNQLENHQAQKDQVHEGEFRLGKLPLEIQDAIAPRQGFSYFSFFFSFRIMFEISISTT